MCDSVLNPALIETALSMGDRPSLSNQPQPWRIQIFDRVTSTNENLWTLLQQGASEGTVVIAAQQDSGRGQRGRSWLSSRGGLYLSAAVGFDIPVQHQGRLLLGSAWGIATELRQRGIPVGLKWPNDLVVEGQKLGGILIETRIRGDRIAQAVVGVGINWSNPVPETGVNLLSLRSSSPAPTLSSLNDLAAAVLRGLEVGFIQRKNTSASTFVSAYEMLLVNRGQAVNVPSESGDTRRGQVVGVNGQGHLRVLLAEEGDRSAVELTLPPGTIHLGYGLHYEETPG